ncbi:hypothetical protein AB0F81_07320 [Actinoplanes sp. NPDC024001]|uniref:hypothetical protein n=1 Tax=Actinoplanes sp. NPDC024001 TaxID=3154598 RepID=UPI0033D4FA0F
MPILFDRDRDSLTDFLTRWYGPPQREPVIGSPAGALVPAELVEWHRAVSAWEDPVTFQDYPLPFEELSPEDDQKMIFWVENQGGYVWAVDLATGKHEVFVGDPVRRDWETTGLSLGDFLVQATLTEAILGSGNSAFVPSVPVDQAHAVLREFTALGIFSAADPDPGARLYIGSDALAQVATPPGGYPAGDQHVRLNIAGLDHDALQRHLSAIDPDLLVWGGTADAW